MSEFIYESAQVPVIADVDVLVCGGGPAGIGASIMAARLGASVMVVESQGCLGGIATAGMMSHWGGRSSSKVMPEIWDLSYEKSKDIGWTEENGSGRNGIYHDIQKIVLDEIEAQINAQMLEYNNYIYNGSKESPALRLTSNEYDFKTINDSGTGTSYKSLVIFDLSILSLTNLPALVHDSVIFKNIGDEPIVKILELYTEFPEKQIFIAMDKADSYHNSQAQDCLEKNTVLRLSAGNSCLFGWSWSETKKS